MPDANIAKLFFEPLRKDSKIIIIIIVRRGVIKDILQHGII